MVFASKINQFLNKQKTVEKIKTEKSININYANDQNLFHFIDISFTFGEKRKIEIIEK